MKKRKAPKGYKYRIISNYEGKKEKILVRTKAAPTGKGRFKKRAAKGRETRKRNLFNATFDYGASTIRKVLPPPLPFLKK